MAARGGEPQAIVHRFRVDGKDVERSVAWPDLLPDGRSMLLTDWGISTIGTLAIVDLLTRDLMSLGLEGSGGRFVPNGYVVYASANAALMAVPFDDRTRRTTGTAVALLPDIAFGRNNVPTFAFATDGTFVFATGYLRWSRREPMRLIRTTRAGQSTPLPFEPHLFRRGLALSPDGMSLVAGTWDDSRWLFELERSTRMKLPSEGTLEATTLAWTPDGRRLGVSGPVAGNQSMWGAFLQNADGSGKVETLVAPVLDEIHIAGWTPDGSTFVYWRPGLTGTKVMRIDSGGAPRVMLEERGSIGDARISPDGRWLAFDSTATGNFTIYVVPLSGQGARVAVTSGLGRYPVWSHDGRELLFRRNRAVVAVDVTSSAGGIRFGQEHVLFEWDVDFNREFAVGPRGEFYAVEPVPGAAMQTTIQLRTNWFAEVARLVAGAAR